MRNKSSIPYIIRVLLAFLLIPISLFPIILPLFPWSLFVGIAILVVWLLLFIPGKNVKHVIKLRKGIVYLCQNLHRRHMIRQKMFDIKKHVKKILEEKRRKPY